jgi:hypothetical protein
MRWSRAVCGSVLVQVTCFHAQFNPCAKENSSMIAQTIRSAISKLFSSITLLAPLLCAVPLHGANCSMQSLSGFYGFVINGTSDGSPIAIVGLMATDGTGSISGLETVSENGTILDSLEVLGKYNISSNCTGTLTIQGAGLAPQNFDVTLISGGKAISMVETDSGTTESGTAVAEGPTACSSSRINGSYAIQATGVESAAGPLALSGQINFHGDGTLDGTETTSVNGVITSGKVAGGYKIGNRCFGAASISVGNRNFIHLNLFVVNGGKGIDFIQADSHTMVSGSMQQ